jgi:hypothetical protein
MGVEVNEEITRKQRLHHHDPPTLTLTRLPHVREVSTIALTDKVGQRNFLLAWLGIDQVPRFGWVIIECCHCSHMQKTMEIVFYDNAN